MLDIRVRHSEEERAAAAGPELSMDSVGSSLRDDHTSGQRSFRRSNASSRTREPYFGDLQQHSFSSIASAASTSSQPSADGRSHSSFGLHGELGSPRTAPLRGVDGRRELLAQAG